MRTNKSRSAKTVNQTVLASPPPEGNRAILPFNIPPILLEGDDPSPPSPIGPGNPFDTGPGPVASQPNTAPLRLPEAYSTGRLVLVARDPHSLYAHWDLTQAQQARCNSLSADQRLLIRVHREPRATVGVAEVPLDPGVRHCFIQVDRPGGQYTAEIGYYCPDRQWATIATSDPAASPGNRVSQDKSVRLGSMLAEPLSPGSAGIPIGVNAPIQNAGKGAAAPGTESVPTIKSPLIPSVGAIQGMVPPRVGWIPALGIHPPEMGPLPAKETPNPFVTHGEPGVMPGELGGCSAVRLGRLKAGLGSKMPPPQYWSGETPAAADAMDSVEIADWVRQQAEGEGFENVSSPAGGWEPKGFWFKLGAELVIYGATEPGATITVGDLPVRLRDDGTFSCRFALPDGEYEVEVIAVTAGGQSRGAQLRFRRHTTY